MEKKKTLLIGVNNNNKQFNNEMEELKLLCIANNMEVYEDFLTQNLPSFNSKTYIGKGKILEAKTIVDSEDIEIIVCNDELSPSQIEGLEKELEVTIFDRTFIILEIFKSRARTKESFLQVKIASLYYQLPRLKGLRKGLSRQGGSAGSANRGKGETQLEIDKRMVEARITLYKRELKKLTSERKVQRQKRHKNNIPVIGIVGYTNSGKSTLMNTLLKLSHNTKEVYSEDMLFATLETSTRAINLPNNIKFLLTDTVGFISKLPHNLVESFKSTLEEVKESDLLIEVVDASNEEYESQIEVTKEILKEIGASEIPILYVFNKMDKVEDYIYIPPFIDNAVRISARDNKNIDLLIEEIEKFLLNDYIEVKLVIPYSKSDLANMIISSGKVIDVKYEDDIKIHAKISSKMKNKVNKYII